LVRLGWSHGDQEIFSKDEMISLFKIEDVNSKPSRLDPAKLGWLNQHYLKTDAPEDVARHLLPQLEQAGYDVSRGPAPADVVVALRDRVQTLMDMAERAAVWYRPLTAYEPEAVSKHLLPAASEPLAALRQSFAELVDWTPEAIHAAMQATGEKLGLKLGKIAPALRVAITGTQVSPSIDHTVYLAGREQALQRIDAALALISRQET
ncbi:MAG TPA: glutamate--tRNA ligase, partial [Luteimonas sp.]|nr:glutamate--tRNA ligase [Luteimonas sp.]